MGDEMRVECCSDVFRPLEDEIKQKHKKNLIPVSEIMCDNRFRTREFISSTLQNLDKNINH